MENSDEKKNSFLTPKVRYKLKEYTLVIFIAVTAAFFLKAFFVEAFKIPTASMRETLLVGDFIVVNKLLYGTKTSGKFPLFDFKIPKFETPGIREPLRNEIVVFKFPGNKDELTPSENINYIKRLIGLPGDTIKIISKNVFINNVELNESEKILINNSREGSLIFDSDKIFPVGKNWNEDNYGPIVVPKEGAVINLDLYNINEWKNIIDREHGERVISIRDGKIYLKEKVISNYTFKKNYYFMLGDNRDDSLDSRYWGFVPQELIIGRAELIYWSVDNESEGLLPSIRWSRILHLLH
ncbi:MAG: signal peptidase I [Ignavibacteria bacterium]|nr:signal peptidase I [Ignavibacteria bacterium]